MKLLILNQTMNRLHPALSHQVDVVRGLSNHFEQVQVVSVSNGSDNKDLPQNISAVYLNWSSKSRLAKILHFCSTVLPLIAKFKPDVIFSHMTTIQSLLLAPLSLILRIPHYLWYAHSSSSITFRLTSFMVTGILTSTHGSCPISSNKVFYVGQGIDLDKFRLPISNKQFNKLAYFGRLDPSKDIDGLLLTASQLKRQNEMTSFDIIGTPLRPQSSEYIENLKNKWENVYQEKWFRILESVPREQLRDKFKDYDIFIHAYQGSLDKVLLEATLAGLPVITLNNEYNRLFSSPSELSGGSLLQRVNNWCQLDLHTRNRILQQRQSLVVEKYSLVAWCGSVTNILKRKHQKVENG